MAGPDWLTEPPWALTPLTVGNFLAVLKSQSRVPSLVLWARRCPSIDPEKTTPGIAEVGANCAALHPAWPTHEGLNGGTDQTSSPVSVRNANRPPPAKGFFSAQSERGK